MSQTVDMWTIATVVPIPDPLTPSLSALVEGGGTRIQLTTSQIPQKTTKPDMWTQITSMPVIQH